ncbi:MAG: aconitate hydratase [Niameybacter sp.]|uniref:aconitate hydratase n=1 Tax=Niameybacter sp. TaxID=2033640 RepID=UPI002FCBC2C1
MALTLTEKVLKAHLIEGKMTKGNEIGIRIDQTLTQDSTGTMAYLQFEAMGIDQAKTKRSVAYIDHNMLQQGFENADDHKYLQTVTHKHGIYFSKPGNGICHQVHLERFGVPGQTLLGSDSHTPTGGGIGMIAIGAGGLDVAVAMGGGTYYITMPQVINVELTGKLRQGVSAKDIILEVLRKLGVKGGLGRVVEYTGEGIQSLSVPERATITNMGAELGATTSVFPSDEVTHSFLKAQGREEVFTALQPDEGALYDDKLVIDLDELEPLVALPYSPDNVKTVSEVAGIKVDQVAIGSCTNGSYVDLVKVSKILKGKTVHQDVSLVISPGSKQVLTMLAANGALADLVAAGARILESGCGPCIGMGQAPATDAISLRTFNRNFKGRCGTTSADVYLVSPETAAISALTGVLTSPLAIEDVALHVEMPEAFVVNDNMVISPSMTPSEVEVVRGPNIKPFPLNKLLTDCKGKVLIKVEDNITTDHIMPSNASLLPFRSNVPHLAKFCLTPCDPEFPNRAKANGGGIIVGGDNYGQGSSREHAALAPLELGIRAVITKSFARIHKANLINSGIIPLVFVNATDYDTIDVMDELEIPDAKVQVANEMYLIIENKTKALTYSVKLEVSPRERQMLLLGGKINMIKEAVQEGR